jgi:hypothetical protein
MNIPFIIGLLVIAAFMLNIRFTKNEHTQALITVLLVYFGTPWVLYVLLKISL